VEDGADISRSSIDEQFVEGYEVRSEESDDQKRTLEKFDEISKEEAERVRLGLEYSNSEAFLLGNYKQ